MRLSHNGKRAQTRGWRGAKWVKKDTARRSRRLCREAIRCNEGEDTKALNKGWVW